MYFTLQGSSTCWRSEDGFMLRVNEVGDDPSWKLSYVDVFRTADPEHCADCSIMNGPFSHETNTFSSCADILCMLAHRKRSVPQN